MNLTEWSARLTSMADALSVADGGFTVDPRTGADVRTGYAVAVHPEREQMLKGAVSTSDLLAYANEASDALTLPGRVFGGWRDPESGTVYLDVSVVMDSREDALALARETNQLAIFDFSTMESIRTDALVGA